MAEGKKSFLIYCDLIHTVEKLPDKDAGELFKHMLRYVNDMSPETENMLVEIAFEPIKQSLKRDLKKWEIQHQQRIDAGKKSAEVRKQNATSVNERSISSTVSVNVNVSDSVNVNDSYKKTLLSEIKISDLDNKNQEYYKIAKSFYDLFLSNLQELNIKTTTLENANGGWIDHIRLMIERDKRDIAEIREVWELLKRDDFWKSNILSTKKLREKFDKLIIKARTNGKAKQNNQKNGCTYQEIAEVVSKHFATDS